MRSRLVGAIIIFAAAIALAVTLITSYNQRQTAECQANVNAQFLEVQRDRASINDGDRASVRVLFQTLVQTSNAVQKGTLTPKQAAAINDSTVERYFNTQKDLDKQREDNPLPESINCNRSEEPLK